MINQISIRTKMGWVSVFENNGKIFKIKFGKVKKQNKSKLLIKFKKNLLQFFKRETTDIDFKCMVEGNKIQKRVWNELKKIRPGYTKSYGEIAKKHNLSPRHVGKICSQNNLLLLVPCHRVIKSDGGLGGFSSKGGVSLKKKLLNFEKIFKN